MHSPSKDLSCHTTLLIFKHATAAGIKEEVLLNGIGEFRETLLNPHEWIGAGVLIKMLDNYMKATGGSVSELAKLGYSVSSSQFSFFQLFFFKLAPLKLIATKIRKITDTSISKCFSMDIEIKASNRVEFIVTPVHRDKYSVHMCQYNKGCATASLQAKNYSNIQVKEISCAALSDSPSCRYEFSWDYKPRIIEKISSWLLFRLNSQEQILAYMEKSHQKLRSQYEQIKDLQEFYSHIMMSMGEGVVWCNTDGVVVFTNTGFLKFISIDESAVLNRLFLELISVPGKKMAEILQECRNNPSRSVKTEIVNKQDGANRRVGEATVTLIKSQNRKDGFLIVIRDITETKEIEKMLYLAENRYRSLYENSPAIIIGLDTEGRTIYANPAMVTQSGYSEEELKALSIFDLIAPDSQKGVQQIFSETMSASNEFHEIHFKAKNNEWRSVALSTYQLYDQDGALAGLAGIGVDITETKRLNEQVVKAQRMELLGQLAGGLAHDFSNIISLISGYSRLITIKSKEKKTVDMGQTVYNASNRAYELIRKLVAFSRGNTEVEFAKMCLSDVVKEVESLVVGYATSSIKVTFVIPEQQLYIYGNSGSIYQCILNLCVNARDALRDVGRQMGTITVRLFKTENGEKVRIEVEDNAAGIAPHLIEKIFDPFFTTKKESGGTGLGLSVVYGIVKSHKGTIKVDSRPGDGTTFKMELPLVDSVPSSSKGTEKKGTVVVIDDEPAIRGFCMEVLRHYDYDTVEFPDESSALDWIAAHLEKIKCILVDVNMPGMVPQLFVDQVVGLDAHMSILWMSGQSVPDELKTVIPQHSFIRKPFTPYVFMKHIQKL